MKVLQKWIGFSISLVMLLLGMKTALATPRSEQAKLIAQKTCQYGQPAKPYVRVVTQGDALRVRESPNGTIIGSIPNGWAVVEAKRDRTGQWVRVTTHYVDVGEFDEINYASAPNFKTGWVAARFVKKIGTFCDKPQSTGQVQRLDLVADQEVLMQEDWTDLGDRIARLG